jgi:inorganic pyrophosphatase
MSEHCHDGKVISAWHDIPLFVMNEKTGKPLGTLNFVCEIPRCSRKKFEIATNEPGNPIKQDEKKGVLREFKKGDLYFNYGCLPRTWEDPEHEHPDTGCKGDNDPLDVCEIGLRIVPTGDVRQIKVLGVLAMIDDGETDWKIIAIDSKDRWAPELNDIEDVERLLPGVVDSVREWFRTYKIPDGKPPNRFALNERAMNAKYAMKVVKECHLAWRKLVGQATDGTDLPRNLSVSKLTDLACMIEQEDIIEALETEEGEEEFPSSLIV